MAILLPICIWLVVRTLPATEDDIRRSVCLVDGHSDLCVCSGKDTLVIHSTTVHQQGVWINKHWWWASCDGRVLTVQNDSLLSDFGRLTVDSLRGFIKAEIDSLTELADRKNTERDELEYYLRSHGVQDEGYMQIAAYAAKQTKEATAINEKLKKMQAFPTKGRLGVVRRGIYQVSWFDDKGKHSVGCKPLLTKADRTGQPVILRSYRRQLPWGAYAVRHLPWPNPSHRSLLVCSIAPSDTVAFRRTLLAEGTLSAINKHNLPRLFALDGSAAFSLHGRFLGVVAGDCILVDRKEDKR